MDSDRATATSSANAFDWRARLSARAFKAVAVASVVGAVLAYSTRPSAQLMGVMHWLFTPATVLLCVGAFGVRVPWRWQARLAVGALLFFGLTSTFVLGFIGGPASVLCVAQLLAALLLGRRATWTTLALTTLGVAAAGISMSTGRIAAPNPYDVSFARLQPWLRSGGMALLVLSMIAMTVAMVIENLEVALERAQSEMVARQRAEAERTQAMRIALEAQKLETVGRLAAGVAHDFNNALCVIQMCTQQLERGNPRGNQGTLRNLLSQAIAQATSLAKQLLLLARKHVPTPTRIGLQSFMRDLAKTLQHLMPTDVEVEVELGEDALMLVDKVQLQHALLNLALNARDAMAGGGRLTLRGHVKQLDEPVAAISGNIAPGHWITIEVADTGIGMDAATRARAFEPLFTTKPAGHGTGLGLSSVLASMEMSSGHVTLWTERAHGTRVTLWLPAIEGDAATAVLGTQSSTVDLRGRTVLVAEDSAGVRVLLQEVLTQAGCTVLCAQDGTHALATLENHRGPIDVLCSDVVMPGAPVRELLARFSALHPSAPILILSGYVADDLALRGIAEGRYRQLPKPFTADQLLDIMGELTRAAAGAECA